MNGDPNMCGFWGTHCLHGDTGTVEGRMAESCTIRGLRLSQHQYNSITRVSKALGYKEQINFAERYITQLCDNVIAVF